MLHQQHHVQKSSLCCCQRCKINFMLSNKDHEGSLDHAALLAAVWNICGRVINWMRSKAAYTADITDIIVLGPSCEYVKLQQRILHYCFA